ncbi:MAG: hypothetical protein Q9187_001677 [Circinaria calcarea]
MKRKAEPDDEPSPNHSSQDSIKRRAIETKNTWAKFRDGLFDQSTLDGHQKAYSESQPYKHGVISNLVASDLLRSVRTEIQENLSFTPKETDIYRIHQSGDLTNLDGLDDSSLKLLPSLLTLRDALYSSTFRDRTIVGAED